MEPRPAFAACVLIAPFRTGDVVRLPDPRLWRHYGAEGHVEWCRPSRIGVGPIDWVVSVSWPNVKRRYPTWNGRSPRCRYLATSVELVRPAPCPCDGWPEPEPDAMRPEDV